MKEYIVKSYLKLLLIRAIIAGDINKNDKNFKNY